MRQIFLRFFAYSARKTKIDSPASVPISLGKTAVSYDKKKHASLHCRCWRDAGSGRLSCRWSRDCHQTRIPIKPILVLSSSRAQISGTARNKAATGSTAPLQIRHAEPLMFVTTLRFERFFDAANSTTGTLARRALPG